MRYITKYLTKNVGFKVPVAGMRLFTASLGSLEPIKKMRWDMSRLTIGFTGRVDEEIREYDFDADNIEEIIDLIESDFYRSEAFDDDCLDDYERDKALEAEVKELYLEQLKQEEVDE